MIISSDAELDIPKAAETPVTDGEFLPVGYAKLQRAGKQE
jgi:hypothetical protein